MLDSGILRGLQGLATLSGSFAVTGLLGSIVGHGRVQAFAFTDPLYFQFRDVPYPIKRQSGKVIKNLREVSGIVRYFHCKRDVLLRSSHLFFKHLGQEV